MKSILILCQITLLLLLVQQITSKPSKTDFAAYKADCRNLNQTQWAFYADNDDCNVYYQCSGSGQLLAHYCPKNYDPEGNLLFALHWDRVNHACVWPKEVCDCPGSSFYDEKCYEKKELQIKKRPRPTKKSKFGAAPAMKKGTNEFAKLAPVKPVEVVKPVEEVKPVETAVKIPEQTENDQNTEN